MCSVVLDGCAASANQSEPLHELSTEFSPMYSAYDGEHTFQLTPLVAADTEHSPIIAATVRWAVDPYFLNQDAFDPLPNGVLLTTKRAGKTHIRVTAMTQDGARKTGELPLSIARVTRHEWEAGEAYFNQSGGIRERLRSGYCGLPLEEASELHELMPGCSKCHAADSGYARPATPTQTAGLHDDELLQVFSHAAEPPSGLSSSPFLRQVPEPDCAFERFHTWELDEPEKKGLVWQLRAVPPAVY